MVSWVDAIDEAYERKNLRCASLATEVDQWGWKVRVRPVKVGRRGFVTFSTTRLLKEEGIKGPASRTVAEQRSPWLWLKRKDQVWASSNHFSHQATHAQVWSACGGPFPAKGVLW